MDWRDRLFGELLLEFNPYHDIYGRFATKGGGTAGGYEKAVVKAAGRAARAVRAGVVAVKAAIADARQAAREGGKPPQLDLKLDARVEGGVRVLSTFKSNDSKINYKAAGVLGMRQYLLAASRRGGGALRKGFENTSPDQIRADFLALVKPKGKGYAAGVAKAGGV